MWLLCTSVLLLIGQYCKVNIYSFLKVFFKYFLLFLFAFFLSNSYYMHICILYVFYICIYVGIFERALHTSQALYFISTFHLFLFRESLTSIYLFSSWEINFLIFYLQWTKLLYFYAEFLLDIFSNLSHYSLLLFFIFDQMSLWYCFQYFGKVLYF